MSVYTSLAGRASCAGSGCLCRARVVRYPSDLSDGQWSVLEREARGVMAELVVVAGRPMRHDLRAMVDAVGYVTRYGIEWRALPVDFPPWPAVYAFFERWSARGLPQALVDRLRGRIRVGVGRRDLPSAAIIDAQSVKAAETVTAAYSGYDGGKKIRGQKRHIAVDTLGLLLCVLVTAASVQDRDGAVGLLARLREKFSTIAVIWADGGYTGRLVSWARQVLAMAVTVVKRSDNVSGFVVLPRRWVVERTFGWLMRYRRLVRCYERRPEHHEAMLWWATVHLMTRRLARQLAGAPPAARWAGPTARPASTDKPPPVTAPPALTSPDRRGKVLQLLATHPRRPWHSGELATILGITNINSFRVQLSQWAHQGHITKIGRALYTPVCTS